MHYGTKWPKYAAWWNRMVINPSRLNEFERDAKFAIAHKDIYLQIEKATGVPWPMVACNHRRESDANFNSYLGNGQPLNLRTTIAPVGRGPFTGPNAFVDGGIDAYKLDELADVKDWRLEKMLFWMEKFNGPGYDNKGKPSPYIWGGTNIQERGKYTSDGHFDRSVMDTQPGCAPLLAMIAKLDPSVKFIRETEDGPPLKPGVPPVISPSDAEVSTQQRENLLWDRFARWVAGLFNSSKEK